MNRLSALQLAETVQPFNLAMAPSIDHAEQLLALRPSIREILANEYGVESLAERLCPVGRDDGSVTVLARAEFVAGDQADALVRRIQASGRKLSEPARYVLPAALLLALSRHSSSGLALSQLLLGARADDRTPSALAGVFQDMLDWGVRMGATDLHLNVLQDAPESEVRYTVAGRYIAPDRFRHMPTDLLLDVLAVAWMDIQGGNGAVFDSQQEQQGSLVRQVHGRDILLRWASLAAERGPSVCFRLLDRTASQEQLTLSRLGYRHDQIEQFERLMRAQSGAIVLAGMVGSGKSTTLAALIQSLPDHRKIITLEEPVEYRLERAVQNSISRNLGSRAHDAYAAKLRTIKRSAMTDVLLGEVRDVESGLAFMDLAASGINVYTTVHAPSARAIVQRLSSSFIAIPQDFLLTPGVLKLLVYQVLLPSLCTACAIVASPEELVRQQGGSTAYWHHWLGWIEQYWSLPASRLRLRNPAGCDVCKDPQLLQLAGYQGRTIAAELLEPGLTDFLQQDNAYLPQVRNSAMAHAMQKVAAGQIDPRDIETRFMAFETLALRQNASQLAPDGGGKANSQGRIAGATLRSHGGRS